ncbi:MAG: choloylglycine hydrolase family protein [Rhabdochlamydiaceae bacterium]|nr:choloylglycine hydrolase family protein [Rhabdochlamydiaceae bacterium]
MRFLKHFLLFILPISSGWACTDLVIQTQDGAYINGRSLEFALPLKSKITLNPRGMKNQSKAPNNEKGLSWTSKYGYLSIDVLDEGLTTDGINEAGLSVGVLWFPGVEYPQPPSGLGSNAIVLQDVADWLLGNFSTTAEARTSLAKINIWAESIQSLGIPPVHLAVHDAQGNHLVIEFVENRVIVTNNPNGVMTNFPKLEWHLTNLRNYINLSPLNAAPLTINGVMLAPTGQGTGLHGIPGDWSSPSRFVRASFFKSFAAPVATAALGINLMEHLLNTFDIPIGAVRADDNPADFEQTQWIVIKDLKNKVLYYRTYEDLTLRYIDLKKLDFSTGPNTQSILMESTPQPVDMTKSLLN